MGKHQENKEKGKRQVKDPFSASEQLKSIKYETKRMEKINQKKFAKDKANRIAKETASKTASKTANDRKQRKINQPQHPLTAAFSDSVDVARECIQNKANAAIDEASLGFEQRLTAADKQLREKEQDLREDIQALTIPLKDEELEWISTDGNRTGTTTLGSRMHKLQKTVDTQEQELARQLDDWNKCQAELREMVLQYFGPEGLKQMEEGMFEVGNALSEEFKEFKEEIDAEKKRFANMIKEARNASVEQMKQSEEKLHLRQKKIEEDFLAMLADEEY